MANPKQVAFLIESVAGWNKWREENFFVKIDLKKANLSKTDLNGANLHRAVLWEADLHGSDLSEADLGDTILNDANLNAAKLIGTHLVSSHLIGANLFSADLSGADLRGANLEASLIILANFTGANLSSANLVSANLTGANLVSATLIGTDLTGVNLSETILRRADLSEAHFGDTILGKIDLSETEGLENVHHNSSSTIGTDTLQLSKGKIPAAFLRGCGLSDWEIEAAKLYAPDLSNQEINEIIYKVFDLRATQAIQISPLFISYSHADSSFVDALEVQLNEKGIRFWRDVHDTTAGRLEKQIDRAIRQNPTVLLILSQSATHSDWVEHEVRTARALEKELGRDVLCPIALDDSWKTSPWPKRVMEQVMEYNILDFSAWKDAKTFQQMFAKLIGGLQLFYKA